MNIFFQELNTKTKYFKDKSQNYYRLNAKLLNLLGTNNKFNFYISLIT